MATAAAAKRAYNSREKVLYHAYVREHGPIRGGQKAFRSIKSSTPIARRPAEWYSPRQFEKRQTALGVLSATRRRGEALTRAARSDHTTPDTVRRYTGQFRQRRRGGRWRPTKRDRLVRYMSSYENGGGVRVTVRDSRTASLLGQYGRDVRFYLRERDPNILAQWACKTYRDAKGRVRTFESDPNRLVAAIEKSERDYGAFDIYPEGGASVSSLVGEEA